MFQTNSFRSIECPFGSNCQYNSSCYFKHTTSNNIGGIGNRSSGNRSSIEKNRIDPDKDPRLNKNVNNNNNNNNGLNNGFNNGFNNNNIAINNNNKTNEPKLNKPNFDDNYVMPADNDYDEYNPSDDDPIDLDKIPLSSKIPLKPIPTAPISTTPIPTKPVSSSPTQTHIPIKKRVQFETPSPNSSPTPKPTTMTMKKSNIYNNINNNINNNNNNNKPDLIKTKPSPSSTTTNVTTANNNLTRKQQREKEQHEQEEKERQEREQREKEEADEIAGKKGKGKRYRAPEVEQNPNEAQKLKTSIWNPSLKAILSKPPNKEMLDLISKEDIFDENKWNALGVDIANLPSITVESRTRVPKSVRQVMLFHILEKCLGEIQDKTRAIDEASKIEDKIYADSLSKNVYLNLIYMELPKILKLVRKRERELLGSAYDDEEDEEDTE